MHKNQIRMEKTQNHHHQAQKVKNPSKTGAGGTPKTPKGPGSVEDIKAKMHARIEKGVSLPKVEAKFMNYGKNCFRLTDVEVIQDPWQWRKSL
ncbi:unnamed protein product [Pipistrellus nathusii]|uniref:Nucleophosmin C-terminal domain-containing protein n=1 Tax=Pipistrellus nathusii TaxID=59473 RepID=A0ABP0AE24_PIPNA